HARRHALGLHGPLLRGAGGRGQGVRGGDGRDGHARRGLPRPAERDPDARCHGPARQHLDAHARACGRAGHPDPRQPVEAPLRADPRGGMGHDARRARLHVGVPERVQQDLSELDPEAPRLTGHLAVGGSGRGATMGMGEQAQAEALARAFVRGELSRRELFRRAGGFGMVVVASTSLGAVLAACSSNGGAPAPSASSGRTAGKPKPGGTLKAALTGEPDTLDPATSTIYTGAQVYDNIFNKLIDLDPDGNFYGQLATKWQAADEKTWVFDLVSGARFHNGEPFTPQDVKYTFERILDPKTASSYAPLYDVIDSVEVTGPTQVTFHLKSPFGPFLSNL